MKGIPYTEADIAYLRRIAEEQNSQTVQAAIDRRWLATLDAARDRPALDAQAIGEAVFKVWKTHNYPPLPWPLPLWDEVIAQQREGG